MKALTVSQPWAQLIAVRAKRIETRSWTTRYRGPIAIHAGQAVPSLDQQGPAAQAAWTVCRRPADELPRGVVVATARLVHVEATDSPQLDRVLAEFGAPTEEWLGDYSPSRWAWCLDDIVALPEPIPARGSLGLWEWRSEIEVAPID